MLDNANFLPLCGNGRIDKKADYEAYYRTHPPLTLTQQELLPNRFDLTNPTTLHNITILADEECDDGNRLDLDGCSADCMHVDLWTSACEIEVETPVIVDTPLRLFYQDMVWSGLFLLPLVLGLIEQEVKILFQLLLFFAP